MNAQCGAAAAMWAAAAMEMPVVQACRTTVTLRSRARAQTRIASVSSARDTATARQLSQEMHGQRSRRALAQRRDVAEALRWIAPAAPPTKIRVTLAAAIEDQQLMPDQRGFGNNGTEAARPG